VFLSMKGTKDRIKRQRLTKKAGSVKYSKSVAFKFSKGSSHMFKIHGPELGDLKSIVLEVNYEIVVVTGDKMNAGTDSNIYVTIFGKTGATKKTHLKKMHKNRKPFQQGDSDVFKIHDACVGPMTKLKIEHDNTGIFPGWYLERVVVTDLLHPKWKYYFPCGQWLARDEGDGAIGRTLLGSRDPFAVRRAIGNRIDTKYKITVYTGDKRGAGTDANVYIILQDQFVIETPCLGRLDRIRIGHDNGGFGPGWFLDK
ncbi:LOXH1-like protein, partial [Mya arenaria]